MSRYENILECYLKLPSTTVQANTLTYVWIQKYTLKDKEPQLFGQKFPEQYATRKFNGNFKILFCVKPDKDADT